MNKTTEQVAAWLLKNKERLRTEADRRETSIGELVIHMLEDVLDVYADERDSEITEYRLAQQEGELRTTFSDSR